MSGWVSGRPSTCRNPACGSERISRVREDFQDVDQIWVGQVICEACGAFSNYTRLAETKEERAMVAKKKGKPKEDAAAKTATPRGKTTHRVNVHTPNGSLPTSGEVAPPVAAPLPSQDLGPLVLVPAEFAPQILQEVCELNDKAILAHRKYLQKADEAKEAKKTWEGYATSVQEKLRLVSHESGLPLFDPLERERDQAAMEQAATDGGVHERVEDLNHAPLESAAELVDANDENDETLHDDEDHPAMDTVAD